jgi:hypothetical protein
VIPPKTDNRNLSLAVGSCATATAVEQDAAKSAATNIHLAIKLINRRSSMSANCPAITILCPQKLDAKIVCPLAFKILVGPN